MEEELKYTSKFNGEDTDSILEGAKKVINAELPSLDEIGGFMVYDKEGKAIGLMSSEQVSKVVGGLIGPATSNKNGLISSRLYSELKLSFYSGSGYAGGSDKMYKAFTFSNNTVFSAFITSATIDKTPAMYAITGKAFVDTVEIKITSINGVSEGEKTRYFYKKNTGGNFDFYIYLVRSDKYVIFSQICYGEGYVGISVEEVDINTDDKTEIQTT